MSNYFLVFFSFFISIEYNAQEFIIENVNIVDILNNKIILNQYIKISNDKIVKISRSKIKTSKSTKIINGKGNFIMSGMIDMHAHLPDKNEYNFDNKEYFFNFIANGVTTIRSMRGSVDHLNLKDSINNKLMIGPKLVIGSPIIYTEDTVFKKIEWIQFFQKYKMFDFYKYIYTPNANIADSIYSIMPKGSQWLGHCLPNGIKQSINCKFKSIEHIEYIIDEASKDSFKLNNIIIEMVKSKISVCPNMFWYYISYDQISLDSLLSTNYIRYATKSVRELWIKELKDYYLIDSKKDIEKFKLDSSEGKMNIDLVWKYLHKMNKKGVNLILSPGSGHMNVPGFSYYYEMILFSNAGFSNQDILKMATINAAKSLDKAKIIGQVKTRYTANLILLESNPLLNLTALKTIKGVFCNASYFDKKRINYELNLIELKNK